MNPNMNNINQKTLAKAFYEVMIDLAKSDEDPILLGWRDKNSQTDRFDVFVNNCIQDGDDVLDFGSGLADLYQYTIDKGFDINYSGIDIMPDFIKKSKDRFGDKVKIFNTNILYFFEEFDWVFASGVFSVGFTLEEVIEYIDHFMKISRKGVCLNLLDKTNFAGDVQVSFNPEEVKSLLESRYSNNTIEFINNYSPDDFSIIIRK
jgi:cyclopropane fatty-acyl-phospholipid synthase-like methyltransferase